MPSRLAEALSLRHPPLALYYAQEEPPEAKSFKKFNPGGWGCAMHLIPPALQGKTVSFSRETCHCPGAGPGLGLMDDHYQNFPGGLEAFGYFLSSGNKNWEQGRACARQLEEHGAGREMVETYLEGEGYRKNPELALDFVSHLPRVTPKGPYVIVQPLDAVPAGTTPEVVLMLADGLQLSALVYQANYARQGVDNVRIPFASGCQSIGLLPLFEATRADPKAVVGLVDISARAYLKKLLGRDLLSFAAPWALFQEMEANAGESFLTRHDWKTLREDLCEPSDRAYVSKLRITGSRDRGGLNSLRK